MQILFQILPQLLLFCFVFEGVFNEFFIVNLQDLSLFRRVEIFLKKYYKNTPYFRHKITKYSLLTETFEHKTMLKKTFVIFKLWFFNSCQFFFFINIIQIQFFYCLQSLWFRNYEFAYFLMDLVQICFHQKYLLEFIQV